MIWLIENWTLIIAGIASVIAVIFFVITAIREPQVIRQWLLWAVSEAESELGSGTGELKLAKVYNLFVDKFPWISKIVSYAAFNKFVDEALDQMRELIAINSKIKEVLVNDKSANLVDTQNGGEA